MKVNRHGKPSKAFTYRLKRATSADYGRMVSACVEAIVSGSEDVLGLFPYTLKFPKGFPKGIREAENEDGTNVYRMKAKKLLAWLHARGYTDITTDSLRGAIISSGLAFAAFDAMCEFNEIEEETWQKLSVSTAKPEAEKTPSQST